MARPTKLSDADIQAWLGKHAGWTRSGDTLERELKLKDFGSALAFAVRLGLIAEKKDHHPDITIGWGKARVVWSTHDAGGITALDLELAEATDALA